MGLHCRYKIIGGCVDRPTVYLEAKKSNPHQQQNDWITGTYCRSHDKEIQKWLATEGYQVIYREQL